MKKILIVDDSMFMRNRIKKALTGAGYAVTEATQGQEALEKFGQDQFDCVVTDLVMPILDGIGLLTALRASHPQMPVVVLTADIQQTTRAQCEELKATCFLNKPPDPALLVQSVELALHARLAA
jgi:CheY-like chemotaxis protein